ncbi:TauD/TfdA family dioxygenase [Hellea balneolensis]|uniref:TauD/TfdA family dioxygenase n=1 Tax=Hellea balneolensis TaxID=287478 RepID=UPI00042230BD|nr:TauD/TfdA family dioxygenase [Hellea balneolensis]
MTQIWNDIPFPAIIASIASPLPQYIMENKADIDERLASTGTVLFRGFNIGSAQELDNVIEAYGEDGFTYEKSLSNAVRVNLTPRVFTANEAPQDVEIFLHHEMAQTPLYPSKLFFSCMVAPETGGATPLCRSDILLQKLRDTEPELVAAFEGKGVKYTNIMPEEDDIASGQGRSWKSTFSATSRNEVETRLSELGYSWDWLPSGALKVTTPRLEAIRDIGKGETSFFNQLIAAFRGWKDARNDPSKSITYGDDSPIDLEALNTAITLADSLSYDLNWQAGDVALIDNYRVMHGRRPYTGKRRVITSLIG